MEFQKNFYLFNDDIIILSTVEEVRSDCAWQGGPCASDPPCWCRSVGVSPARDEADTVPHHHTHHTSRGERQVKHDQHTEE